MVEQNGMAWVISILRRHFAKRRQKCFRTVLVLLPFVMIMAGCTGKPPDNLGVTGGELSDCPSKPNCLSSMAGGSSHYIEPLNYEGDSRAAMTKLEKIVEDMPNAKVVERKAGYFRAEYRSSFFGFIDDVEFYLPAGDNTVHIRSASRIGYYDFGVNKKRIGRIRDLWHKQTSTTDSGS